jgi:peptidoglycan/xylan/chitin deacetylase (PgdA/CDA1 family)
MDDGFADQASIAAPLFEEFACPLTLFVITGMLDQKLWPWDAQVAWITETSEKSSLHTEVAGKSFNLPLADAYSRRLAKRILHTALREVPAHRLDAMLQRIARDAAVDIPDKPPVAYRPMTWDTARQLERKGIQFGPHSVTHNILSRLDSESMQLEISESWKTLNKELKNPSNIFCYPTGRPVDYDRREINALRENGFSGAVTTTPGFIGAADTGEEQLYRLPRFALPDSMVDFIQYCTWIEYAKCSHQRNSR